MFIHKVKSFVFCLFLLLSINSLVTISCQSPVVDDEEDITHLTLLGTETFSVDGGTLELQGQHPQVRLFRIEIPSGALSRQTEIQVYLSNKLENSPLNFTPLSPLIEIRPKGLTFSSDIIVLLPYDDNDQNGIIDNTNLSETEIYPGYYSSGNNSWGPLRAMVPDPNANVAAFYTNQLAPFMLWGTSKSDTSKFQSQNSGMFVILNDWDENPTLDEVKVVDILDQHHLEKMFLHVYSASEIDGTRGGVFVCSSDGNALPQGITETMDLFSLTTIITEANQKNVQIILVISAFSNAQPDDNDHKTHLLGVVDYFLSNYYGGVDGIMLDFIRFSENGSPSFNNIQLVTDFVKEVKENHSRGVPVYLALWDYESTYRELLLGQRYVDLSIADYFSPMLYGGETIFSKNAVSYSVYQTTIVRNSTNNLKVIPLLQTYGSITTSELEQQILGSLEGGADGIAFFRLATTGEAEWDVIGQYISGMVH